MTWPLASFLILGVALAAGFAWYERTHPSSRVLALVGTLAALAALGRIAFAPVPNVKPTTDIVLIAGFALGGPAGFAVGAIAALTSNLFFGQGPWTPWQMAAWGLVGLLGAGLGALTKRRIGRLPLAAACGVAGYAYGAVMDVSIWTLGGAQSAGTLGAAFATSLWWDVAHVVGNVAFALAFGPALVRALGRFRTRFEVRWHPVAPLLLVAAVAAGAFAVAGVRAEPARAATSPAAYLRGAQNADGGWGSSPDGPSSSLFTAWAVMGLEAAGAEPGDSPVAYLRAHPGTNDGDLERTILAIRSTGADAGALVKRLRSHQRPDGSFAGQANLTAFGILALRSAGAGTGDAAVRRAVAWLVRQQNRDGGFGFGTRGGQSGIDDTSGALQGLVAAGRRHTRAAGRAAAFLARHQRGDGGYPLTPNGASNAQSTAWAIQGLLAAGRTPPASAYAFLRGLVRPDGSVRYSHDSGQTPVWVTGQVLTALAEAPLPLGVHTPGAAAPVVAPRKRPERSASRSPSGSDGRAPARAHARTDTAPPAADAPSKHRARHGKRSAGREAPRRRDRPAGRGWTGYAPLAPAVVDLARRAGAALGLAFRALT